MPCPVSSQCIAMEEVPGPFRKHWASALATVLRRVNIALTNGDQTEIDKISFATAKLPTSIGSTACKTGRSRHLHSILLQIYLLMLSFIYHPFSKSRVLSIWYQIMTPIAIILSSLDKIEGAIEQKGDPNPPKCVIRISHFLISYLFRAFCDDWQN